MRPDQLQRLQDLSETLADRFLFDADPEAWTGGGKTPADMSQQERGDALWCRKLAMSTGGVLRYALDLLAHHQASASGGSQPEDAERDADLDRKISDAERRAKAAVDRVLQRAKDAPASKAGNKG